MYVKRIVVDRGAQGHGDDLPLNPKGTSLQLQHLTSIENAVYHPIFLLNTIALSGIIKPLIGKIFVQFFLVGGERPVGVVRIKFLELIDMVAFGL